MPTRLNIEPVVITGAGVLACNGIGRETFWNAIENGVSGINYITRFDTTDLPCRIAGQLWDFDPNDFMKKADVKRWHPSVHQSVAAARLAMDDSDLSSAGYDSERIATGIGTSVGDIDAGIMEYYRAVDEGGWQALPRLSSSATSGHASTANVSAEFLLRGPAITIGSGCSTGLDALGWGVAQIRAGLVDAAVIGATETPVFNLAYSGAARLGILCTDYDTPQTAMRPFDKRSSGLVLAEAAVVLVLEREGAAKARGARILGRVAGYGSASEGHSAVLLQRDGHTISHAIRSALEDAGLSPEDIDCVHCHGVSLSMYDMAETHGLKGALGEHVYRIPVTANKSMIGQAYSVGGLLSVASALLSLNRGVIPPTLNFEQAADGCDLDYVPGQSRINDPETALVNTLSFGGTHSSVILGKANGRH
jgi:3-oxoacyl-[acyl-carrier-protein] synthase II